MIALLRDDNLPIENNRVLKQMLPDLLSLGQREHILTDYGDEETYTLPWDLLTPDCSLVALNTAIHSVDVVQV